MAPPLPSFSVEISGDLSERSQAAVGGPTAARGGYHPPVPLWAPAEAQGSPRGVLIPPLCPSFAALPLGGSLGGREAACGGFPAVRDGF